MFKPTEVIRKFLDEKDLEANFDVEDLAKELIYANNREWGKARDVWTKSLQRMDVKHRAELAKLRDEHAAEGAALQQTTRARILDIFISIVEAQTYKEPYKYVQKASIKAMKALDENNNVGICPA